MNIKPIKEVKDALIIERDRYDDSRGFFEEVYSSAKIEIENFSVQQSNLSQSSKNVVRGLHQSSYAKLCTCISGHLFDVMVDLRPHSPTYLNWFGIWLSSDKPISVYIPGDFAHGFYSAEDNTMLLYHIDEIHNPDNVLDINWLDPTLNIDWPKKSGCILSDKDRDAKTLSELLTN